MKVIKSDARYKFFNQGFKVILEFRIKVRQERDHYFKVYETVESIYGNFRTLNPETSKYEINPNFRVNTMSDNKRRRIYLRDEAEVSLILLKIEA